MKFFARSCSKFWGAGYSLRRVATAKAGDSQLDSAETDVVLLNLDLQNGAPQVKTCSRW